MDCPYTTEDDCEVIRIDKPDGGVRVIYKPKPELRKKLDQILKIMKNQHVSFGPYVHGFIRHRSIKTNAEALTLKNPNGTRRSLSYMLKMDITNYFHSIRPIKVRYALERHKFAEWAIDLIMATCLLRLKNGSAIVPQGFPTSPFIAALVMKEISYRLAGLMRQIDPIFPTRLAIYADNITFTSDSRKIITFAHQVRFILKKCYKMEIKYSTLNAKPARLVVCGVQINDKIGPPRNYWRTMRAQLFNATCDRKAGLVPAGFSLNPRSRQVFRANAGIYHSKGLIKKKNLDQRARANLKIMKKNLTPIPFSEWKGQIEFIRSLDQDKGQKLLSMYKEMCEWHQHQELA